MSDLSSPTNPSFERQVFESLKSILAAGLTWARSCDFEIVKLAISEFKDTELPAVQFWLDEEPFDVTKQRGHAQVDIRITIEIVMKPTAAEPLTQGDFLDRLSDVREVLSDNVTLNINGKMQQVVPVRAARDYVTQEPYMVGQLQISVTGQVPYGDC